MRAACVRPPAPRSLCLAAAGPGRGIGWQSRQVAASPLYGVSAHPAACSPHCRRRETADRCLQLLKTAQPGAIQALDITGGAPELNPEFRWGGGRERGGVCVERRGYRLGGPVLDPEFRWGRRTGRDGGREEGLQVEMPRHSSRAGSPQGALLAPFPPCWPLCLAWPHACQPVTPARTHAALRAWHPCGLSEGVRV